MGEERQKQLAAVYAEIVASYISGIIRINCARIVQNSTVAALVALNSPSAGDASHRSGGESPIDVLRAVSLEEFDAYRYVGGFGHLVYSMSLLDTFLTDTTRFILMAFPSSIGKAQGVTVEDIISAKSTSDLLAMAVEKKARELSYKSFVDRLEHLEKNYSLRAGIDQATREQLEHYSHMRNVMVHDQGHLDFRLAADGAVELSHKTCPVHPTPVKSEDIQRALEACKATVAGAAAAVFRDMLRVEAPTFLATTRWGQFA
ncbi:MAG: hypothetical protein IT327_24180 [Anaerolineae bacterium]|nr:hypothetical protein [Anaerolineae bacterium]